VSGWSRVSLSFDLSTTDLPYKRLTIGRSFRARWTLPGGPFNTPPGLSLIWDELHTIHTPSRASTSSRMPDAAKPVVAIVDPISTGASLAKFLSDRGYPLVRVFSDTLPDEESTHGGHTVAHPSARLSGGLFQRHVVPQPAPSFGRFGRGRRVQRRKHRAGLLTLSTLSAVLSTQVKALVAEGLEVDWRVTIQHEGPGRAEYTAAALRGVGVTEVIVGSEPGVSLQAPRG